MLKNKEWFKSQGRQVEVILDGKKFAVMQIGGDAYGVFDSDFNTVGTTLLESDGFVIKRMVAGLEFKSRVFLYGEIKIVD